MISIWILCSLFNLFRLLILFLLRLSFDKDFNFLRVGGIFVKLFVFRFNFIKCFNFFIDFGKFLLDNWLLFKLSFLSIISWFIKFLGMDFKYSFGIISCFIVLVIFCMFLMVLFLRLRSWIDIVFFVDLVGRCWGCK